MRPVHLYWLGAVAPRHEDEPHPALSPQDHFTEAHPCVRASFHDALAPHGYVRRHAQTWGFPDAVVSRHEGVME